VEKFLLNVKLILSVMLSPSKHLA